MPKHYCRTPTCGKPATWRVSIGREGLSKYVQRMMLLFYTCDEHLAERLTSEDDARPMSGGTWILDREKD